MLVDKTIKLETAADTGADSATNANMRN